jgi:hypothetical protein
MAKYEFIGGYPLWYPFNGLYAKPGEVHELTEAPDANWRPVDGATASATAVPVSDATSAPNESVSAAEALLEANPALAEKLVKEAAQNA